METLEITPEIASKQALTVKCLQFSTPHTRRMVLIGVKVVTMKLRI